MAASTPPSLHPRRSSLLHLSPQNRHSPTRPHHLYRRRRCHPCRLPLSRLIFRRPHIPWSHKLRACSYCSRHSFPSLLSSYRNLHLAPPPLQHRHRRPRPRPRPRPCPRPRPRPIPIPRLHSPRNAHHHDTRPLPYSPHKRSQHLLPRSRHPPSNYDAAHLWTLLTYDSLWSSHVSTAMAGGGGVGRWCRPAAAALATFTGTVTSTTSAQTKV
jgi:hypothetical protein